MLVALGIVNALLIVYLILLSLRIILTWFAPQGYGRPFELLRRSTDPYLGVFARMRFLRKGFFDFSPIAAILVLVVVLNLINVLMAYGRISVGLFVAAVLSAVWSGARFLLLLFLIAGLLRVIPLFFRGTAGSAFWRVVDLIVQPVVALVMRLFRLGGRSGFTQYLLMTDGILLAAWLLGELLIGWLVQFFQFLPF